PRDRSQTVAGFQSLLNLDALVQSELLIGSHCNSLKPRLGRCCTSTLKPPIERSAPTALREEIRVERAEVEADIRGAEEIISSFGEPVAFEPTDWVKVIPVREIESASFYDPDAYDAWFGTEVSAGNQAA